MSNLDAGIKALSDAVLAERDRYSKTCEDLQLEISLLSQKVDQMDVLLKKCEAERNHYMRQLGERNQLIRSLSLLLQDGLEQIAQGTYRPNGAANVEEQSKILEDEIANLAHKLGWDKDGQKN